MDLKYVLKQLDTYVSNLDGFSVFVVKDYNRITQDLPLEEFYIYGVEIEDEDREITLLTEGNQPLSANELFEKLCNLMPEYKDHTLFSGSPVVEFGTNYTGRLDSPLITMGFDNESKKIAFVQEGKNS